MAEEEKAVIVKKLPSRRKRIRFPFINRVFAIEEMHTWGINLKDFSIYLTPVDKTYHGDDASFEEPGVEYQMASRFIKNLHILSGRNSRKQILVHMMSYGGDWEKGMAIFDALSACPNPVTILCYGHARSMSSIILQAADRRVLMPHSYFLFHWGTLELSGTTKGVLATAEWVKREENPTMVEIYATAMKRKGKYSGRKLSDIRGIVRDKMDRKEDVFLTAKEAVEWGLADEVFGGTSGQFDWRALRKYSETKA